MCADCPLQQAKSVGWMMDDVCVPMALCSALYVRGQALCPRSGPCLDTTKNSYFL